MRSLILAATLAAIATAAAAQVAAPPAEDPVITRLKANLGELLFSSTVAQSRADTLADLLAKANARIADLEVKLKAAEAKVAPAAAPK